MSGSARRSLATRCIHAGEDDLGTGSPHTPTVGTSTFTFGSTAAMESVVSGESAGNLYTRYGFNPTILALEAKLAALEGAEAALSFASGMAALATTFVAHGRAGIVTLGECYGGTMELLTSQLPELGIHTTMLDTAASDDELTTALGAGARMVFFETPTNPTMQLVDIEHVSRIAARHEAIVVVDNTFATPVNQRPLELGAHLSVHSATKGLSGHSDVTAGAVMGSASLIGKIWNWRKNLGGFLNPESATLLARSIRTLPVRVAAQNAAAAELAARLEAHPGVARVHYPGLPSHPQAATANRQMSGFGSMISVELESDRAGCAAVADALRLWGLGPSLGGVESLAVPPVSCTHYWVDVDERARRGISDSMLRLSVGLEDVDDLWADLDQALATLGSAKLTAGA